MIEENKRRNRTLWIVLSSVALILFFSICGVLFVGILLFNATGTTTTQSPVVERAEIARPAAVATVVPVQPIQIPAGMEDYETAVLTTLYQRVGPAVVNVDVLSFGSNLPPTQPFLFPQGTPVIPDLQIDP